MCDQLQLFAITAAASSSYSNPYWSEADMIGAPSGHFCGSSMSWGDQPGSTNPHNLTLGIAIPLYVP